MSYQRIILAGLIASIVMGMWEMVVEQVAGGNGFWSPVTYIAATILRDYQQVPTPVPFEALPVVLGLMGHMMNSVLLGAGFALITRPAHGSRNELIAFGAAYGIAVMLIMWLVVLPLVDPVMLRVNVVGFFIAHIMWGVGLGIALGWTAENARSLRPARA